jgi:hypothetical protein
MREQRQPVFLARPGQPNPDAQHHFSEQQRLPDSRCKNDGRQPDPPAEYDVPADRQLEHNPADRERICPGLFHPGFPVPRIACDGYPVYVVCRCCQLSSGISKNLKYASETATLPLAYFLHRLQRRNQRVGGRKTTANCRWGGFFKSAPPAIKGLYN